MFLQMIIILMHQYTLHEILLTTTTYEYDSMYD